MNPVLSRMRGLKDFVFCKSLGSPAFKKERPIEPLNYFDIQNALSRRLKEENIKSRMERNTLKEETIKAMKVSGNETASSNIDTGKTFANIGGFD